MSARFSPRPAGPGEGVVSAWACAGTLLHPWPVSARCAGSGRPVADPEALAYGRAAWATLPLYRVRFRKTELWPDYDGRRGDRGRPAAGRHRPESWMSDRQRHLIARPPAPQAARPRGCAAHPAHGADGGRLGPADGQGHRRRRRLRRQLESCRRGEPGRRRQRRGPGLGRCGVQASACSRTSIAAARELGIDAGAIPIRVVASTPDLHNLIVCTLCSCYPRFCWAAAGLVQGSRLPLPCRSRAARRAARVRAVLPAGVRVEVHDSTAELRYMVLPCGRGETEGWDEERSGRPGHPRLHDRRCRPGSPLSMVQKASRA